MSKRALITGITGQDGSYLAEFLLAKEYQIFGMTRRTSTMGFERIEHLMDRLHLLQGDLLDQNSLVGALQESQPDEVYNLAAQSFVPTSWNQPVLTGEFTALGVTRLLEAVRLVQPRARFYQASSSEMFGHVREVPQRETTSFYPRSPYGVAKVYGHWITVNYRESYGLYTVSGMLFNHESVTAETPVFIRRGGLLDLLPIEDLVPHRADPKSAPRYTSEPAEPLEVWDRSGWAKVTCMTAYWNGYERKPNKDIRRIAARGAVFHATSEHNVFTGAGTNPASMACERALEEGRVVLLAPKLTQLEQQAGRIRKGDHLALIDLPKPTDATILTEAEAWLLGILAAEGYINEDGKVKVANQDQGLLDEVAACWQRVCGGNSSRYSSRSGFKNGRPVTQLCLTGAAAYARYLRESLYTCSGHKRIPKRVLNAPHLVRLAFLRGFNAGDGLKSTPCTYEFQGFKTASTVLAAGLYWLAVTTLEQRAILCTEEREGRLYYQINLNSPNVPGQKGQHLLRPLAEVVKAESIEYHGWLFDLATTTGTFHAGVGQAWIRNSPRRGLEFVTRKVSDGVARIALGLEEKLKIGNLEAKRDWGYAGDYVQAMWMMLQQDEPDDYVIATGETHSVRELVHSAFELVGLDWEKHVEVDPALLRPAEVDMLVGDATKAGQKLGWKPTVDFSGLVRLMVEADLERLSHLHGLPRPELASPVR